jgi:ABC-2 type transport system ATP-binding protein
MSAATPELAVEVRDVVKHYPKTRRWRDMLRAPTASETVEALRGVTLEVPRGTVHGLLGANGAGKTTLLKILSTLVVPTEGSARVVGFDVDTESEQVRRRLGFVTAQERSFYWRLSGRQNLLFFAALHDLRGEKAARQVASLLEIVGLGDDADRNFREYSSGMMQKVAIARGLLGDPELILMDEPTASLDPPSTAWVQEFTRDTLVRERGATVLIATHDLLEAESTCDSLSLVDEGRIVKSGTVAELKRPLGKARRSVITLLEPTPEHLAGRDLLPISNDAQRRSLYGPAEDRALAAVVAELSAAGARVVDVRPEQVQLAELFDRVGRGDGAA